MVVKALPFTVDYLTLVHGNTIPFTWILVTKGYFKHTFIGLIFSVTGVFYYRRLLKPIWGSKEFVKFIAFTSFFTTICIFVISIFLYYVTGHENLLYTPIAGFHGVLVGFQVAMKHIFPDYEINTRQVIKMHAKWLPSFLVLIVLVVSFFVDNPIVYIPFIIFGTYGS
ncbi:hypothetical protein Mapa_004570 [Marchantia paleacea]|nr:hypothetical protein Mapa_004570 [Marchantia paleacea]